MDTAPVCHATVQPRRPHAQPARAPRMTSLRRLIDRVVPRGALILSVLSIGYFAAGVVRHRSLAGEFGAGAQLDAYNAAFRIPEIALDILVGAGLSAPFVPIFSRLLAGNRPGATTEELDRAALDATVDR